MKIIVPKKINTDFTIASTTVVDRIVSEYQVSNHYVIDDEVVYTPTSGMNEGIPQIYRSIASVIDKENNIGKLPDEAINYWVGIEPTNKYAMFDSIVSTCSTSEATDITVTLSINDIDHIAFLNTTASEININISGQEPIVILNANPANPTDIITNFPLLTTSTNITLLFKKHPDFSNKIGNCILGKSTDIGYAQWGANATILDYSKQITNPNFGYTYLAKGNYKKKLDIDLMIPTTKFNEINDFMTNLRGTPIIVDANQNGSDYRALTLYGFLKPMTILLKNMFYVDCSLSIEGLI